jgi:penicillin-binding protein 1A
VKIFRVFVNVVGWCAFTVVLLIAGAMVAAWMIYSRYEERASRFDLSGIAEVSQRSAVYDGNGELYSYLHGQNRLVIPLDHVSPHFTAAVLAREDSRFWQHDGVDLKGVIRAAWANFREGAVRQVQAR